MTAIPANAQAVANDAFREARAEGCNCDPNIVLSPLGEFPDEDGYRATVEHDAWCRLVARLRAALT